MINLEDKFKADVGIMEQGGDINKVADNKEVSAAEGINDTGTESTDDNKNMSSGDGESAGDTAKGNQTGDSVDMEEVDEQKKENFADREKISDIENEDSKKRVKKEPKYRFDRVDVIMLSVIFILSFMCIKYYNFNTDTKTLGLGATVYMALYVISILGYAKSKSVKLRTESIFLSVLIILLAISFTYVYNYSLNVRIQMVMNFLLIYLPVTVFNKLIKRETSTFILFDYINALILIPIHNATSFWACIFSKREKDEKSENGTYLFNILLGLLVGSPLIIIIILLLSSADATFKRIFDNLFTLNISVPQKSGTFIWAIPMATYLYALIYGSSNNRKSFNVDKFNESINKIAVVPGISIYAVNVVICSFYTLFIGIQAMHFINILRRVFSEDFTYSEYARRGFAELICIALINIFFIWGTKTLAVKNGNKKYMRIHICLISVLTLILIGVNFAKMYLYINTYGLTSLRVVPSVFMVFLCFVFAFVILGEFKEDFKVAKLSFYTGTLMFVLLSLSNIDGLVAQYNLNAYVSGRLPRYDIISLLDSDMAAIPVIYKYWQTSNDGEFKDELYSMAGWIGDYELDSNDYGSYNYTKNKALQLLKLMDN